jgi:hypothetical protein
MLKGLQHGVDGALRTNPGAPGRAGGALANSGLEARWLARIEIAAPMELA